MTYIRLNNKLIKISKFGILITFISFFLIYVFKSIIDQNLSLKAVVLLILLYTLYSGLKEKNIINPYILFSTVPLSIFIYSENIAPIYLSHLSDKLWILTILNMTSFLISFKYTKNTKRFNIIDLDDSSVLMRHSIVFYSISMLPVVYKQLLSTNLPFYSVITLLIYPAIVFAIKSKNKIFILTLFSLILIRVIDNVDKTGFLFLVIVTLISIEKYYAITWGKKIKLIIYIILSIVLMITVFSYRDYLRSGGDFSSYINGDYIRYDNTSYYSEKDSVNWPYSKKLLLPYLYFTTPWANLQYVIETQDFRTFGLWFFKPLLGYLQLDNIFLKNYDLQSLSNFNTFTYISVLFKDFGYFGSSIGSVFIGWYTKKIYSAYSSSYSPFYVTAYGLVAVAIFQMFFSNHFFMQSYPFTIVILLMGYSKMFGKQKKELV